jgi:hypothetical protein
MNQKSKVLIFIDDASQPLGEFDAPVKFDFDTRKLVDGQHTFKVVSKDPSGREGVMLVPFTVRNGPAIAIEGLSSNDVVDGVLPIMVNAYGKGDQKKFLIDGSETPRSIPAWVWATLILFVGWAAYYVLTFINTPA